MTKVRTCPLCEATCGLEIELSGRQVTKVKGDSADIFSSGFICPKGASIGELHSDPDRLTSPLIKRGAEHVAVGWDEAFEAIEAGFDTVLGDGDRNAVGAYVGNPNAHNLDSMIYLRPLLKALGSRNVFSASTVDQMPKQVSSGLMFGAGLSVPVPDIDRTDYLLILGANPMASNGSLLTAPDMRGRLRALRARGGKLVVIDPRKSRTAKEANEHHFIRPARDAHLLAALAHTILDEGKAAAGAITEHTNGLDQIAEHLGPFSAEAVGPACGITAAEIRRIASELAGAERAAVYARIGTTTQEFGTLASWLVDVLNLITGNLDREGGAMFPKAAAGATNATGLSGSGRGTTLGRWQSRVRGLDEAFGELPAVCMAEEMDTPGDGQIRALLTIAGNPLVSTPNSDRLRAAVEGLEFMVSIDCYLNETTRHADVILPVPTPLERSHYDLALYQLGIRNVANYSPSLLEVAEGMVAEWRTILRLIGTVTGQGADADTEAIDDFIALEVARRETVTEGSPGYGLEPGQVLGACGELRGPERILDILLRAGPYGAGFGEGANGEISLGHLIEHPHGVDLGALEPRIPEALRTPSGKIELCPAAIIADLPRLEESLARAGEEMVLIGRRHLRSNNSWMHNLPKLAGGPERCTMQVHPSDVARLGLNGSGRARVRARTGEVELAYEATEEIMPGVVSIPHGWGHDQDGTRMGVAAERPGVNSNILADEQLIDPLSGNAVLNGIPVTVTPA